MHEVILKVNLPTGKRSRRTNQPIRHMAGSLIKVDDVDYARLVPRYAHDAADYLEAQAAAKAKRDEENPKAVKAFVDAQESRRRNAKAIKEAAERAAARAKADRKRREEARLKVLESREARKKKIVEDNKAKLAEAQKEAETRAAAERKAKADKGK